MVKSEFKDSKNSRIEIVDYGEFTDIFRKRKRGRPRSANTSAKKAYKAIKPRKTKKIPVPKRIPKIRTKTPRVRIYDGNQSIDIGKVRRKVGRPRKDEVPIKIICHWNAMDDYKLITNMVHCENLEMIFNVVKFGSKFPLHELHSRWTQILYDPAVFAKTVQRVRSLHPLLKKIAEQKVAFNYGEVELLKQFRSNDKPNLKQFEEMLNQNLETFYVGRTAKELRNYWHLLKKYKFLEDQNVVPLRDLNGKFNRQPNLSEIKELAKKCRNGPTVDEYVLQERARQQKLRINLLRVIDEKLSNISMILGIKEIAPPTAAINFDANTLATLRGKNVTFTMKASAKTVTLGRSAKTDEGKNDENFFDLSEEGFAENVSRRQSTITVNSDGVFFIVNEGKRAVFVNGTPVIKGEGKRLGQATMIEICDMGFLFVYNEPAVNRLREEALNDVKENTV